MAGRIDAFTGLPTWEAVAEKLGTLTSVERIGAVGINIRNMRGLNEEYGHEGGDEVLAVVAHRLVESVHEHDLAARVEGDAFLVLTDFAGSRPDQLASFAAELEAAISSEPITVHGEPVQVPVTVKAAMVATPNDLGRLMESVRTRVRTVGDVLTEIDVGSRRRSPQELRVAFARFMDAPVHMHFVDPPEESFEVVDVHHYKMLLGFAEALMQRIEEDEA